MSIPLSVYLITVIPLAALAGAGVVAVVQLARRPVVVGQPPLCGARPVGQGAPPDWRCVLLLGHKYLHQSATGGQWGAHTFIPDLRGEFTTVGEAYMAGKHARPPAVPVDRRPHRLPGDLLDGWPDILGDVPPELAHVDEQRHRDARHVNGNGAPVDVVDVEAPAGHEELTRSVPGVSVIEAAAAAAAEQERTAPELLDDLPPAAVPFTVEPGPDPAPAPEPGQWPATVDVPAGSPS